MKRSIIRILCILVCMAVLSVTVAAEPKHKCTLTLNYTKNEIIFPGMEIKIYRIADAGLEALAAYRSYPVQLKGVTSQTEWSETAATLRSYIQADCIKPYAQGITDIEGNVVFGELEEGLYLVMGVSSRTQDSEYTFYDFMIMLPQDCDGTYNYDVVSYPKAVVNKSSQDEQTYTVTKLWQGVDDGDRRPLTVTVDILKNGSLFESVILDSQNHWSYSFTSNEPDSIWSVAERNVPEGYTVRVIENQSSFVIVNSLEAKDSSDNTKPGGNTNAPQTGDTAPLRLYLMLMCISGLLLMILGLGMRRKNDAQ